MHYRNGREAKIGDVIVGRGFDGNGVPMLGVVFKQASTSDTCNLTAVPLTVANTVTLTAKECLHIDDAFPPKVG